MDSVNPSLLVLVHSAIISQSEIRFDADSAWTSIYQEEWQDSKNLAQTFPLYMTAVVHFSATQFLSSLFCCGGNASLHLQIKSLLSNGVP